MQSKLDRDLAVEAAIRAILRRAACPDPKCSSCGEDRLACLVFGPGDDEPSDETWPLCRNCLADRRDPARKAAARHRFARLGLVDPHCLTCGEDHVWRLELDHI